LEIDFGVAITDYSDAAAAYALRTGASPYLETLAHRPRIQGPERGGRKDEENQRGRVAKNDGAPRRFVLYLCPLDLLYKGTFVRIFAAQSTAGG
jgi:hypothetical protein